MATKMAFINCPESRHHGAFYEVIEEKTNYNILRDNNNNKIILNKNLCFITEKEILNAGTPGHVTEKLIDPWITAYEFNSERISTESEKRIIKEYQSLMEFALKKDRDYGESINKPLGIFNKNDSEIALCARIDDKLSRIKNKGINDKTEDTITDLIGYLVRLKIAINNKNK